MRTEYILVATLVGLGGMGSLQALGGGFDHAIAGQARSAGGEPRAMVTSGQAALWDNAGRAARAGETARTAEAARVVTAAPRALTEYLSTWADDMAATVHVDPAAPQRVLAAEKALSRRDLPDFLRMTLRTGTEPDRGFAIALDALPEALTRWNMIKDASDQSATVRELMGPNFTFLLDATERVARRLDSEIARWDGHQSASAGTLEGNGLHLAAARRALERALHRETLSKREAYDLVDQTMNALNFEDRLAPGMGGLGRRIKEHRALFPLVSDTYHYWDYARVPAWFAAGAYPIEFPLFTKAFNGVISGLPTDFAMHDRSHIMGTLLRGGDPTVAAQWRGLAKLADAERAMGASPRTVRELNAYLGEIIWDGDLSVTRLANDSANLTPETRRILAGWFSTHGTESQRAEARNVLAEIPPDAFLPESRP